MGSHAQLAFDIIDVNGNVTPGTDERLDNRLSLSNLSSVRAAGAAGVEVWLALFSRGGVAFVAWAAVISKSAITYLGWFEPYLGLLAIVLVAFLLPVGEAISKLRTTPRAQHSRAGR